MEIIKESNKKWCHESCKKLGDKCGINEFPGFCSDKCKDANCTLEHDNYLGDFISGDHE